MKTHLFNTLQVTMIGMSKRDGELSNTIFKNLAEGFGFTLQAIHKPKIQCNMKLVGGDESDFNTMLDLVREQLRNKF